MMRKELSVFFLLFLMVSCSQTEREDFTVNDQNFPSVLDTLDNLMIYPADTEPAYEIQLIREQTFNSTNDVWIGYIDGIAIDDRDRVFIGDIMRKMIHVFQPDGEGEYVTSMGKEGGGPGEFSELTIMRPRIQSNQLFLYDEYLQRINVYSLRTLSPSHTIIMDKKHWNHIEELKAFQPNPRRYFVRNDSTLLMGFTKPFPLTRGPVNKEKFTTYERENRYYSMDMNGKVRGGQIFKRKEIFTRIGQSGPVIMIRIPYSSMPFVRNSLMAVANDGKIFSAWSEEFLIKVYNSKGGYLRSFYYPYRNSPLKKQKVIDAFADSIDSKIVANRFRNMTFPDTWPVLGALLVDDRNRLWVSTITGSDTYYQWWVLDEKGTLLAKFTWPGNRRIPEYNGNEQIKVIKNEYLYTVKSGRQIVKYRIVMN